jgi:methionine sulfoxide reductase catalytic subunit
MLIKRAADIRSSEITDKKLYLNRREFLRASAGSVAAAAAVGALGGEAWLEAATPAPHGRKLENLKKSPFSTDEKPNRWEDITTYNNYYEFGIDKDSPSMLARSLKTEPWTVTVDGECAKKGAMNLEDVLKGETLEERIYRHRCVERWSMVIPWVGFPLANFIKKCEPTAKAKFVEFQTLNDPRQMPGMRSPVLRWPYVEGLRMDEAMHPLTLMVVGLYGEVLPNQDGAPLRLAVPWKYGFKSVKSIVRFEFTDKRPVSYWEKLQASEYGFWANVNPAVPHPRWSQASERVLGSDERRPTLIWNGYGEFVADLYKGLEKERLFA